jgi:hypothetical protein
MTNSCFNVLRRGGWRDWLGALALLGLLVRALVPAGFMPAQLHGEVQLVLCSGDGGGPFGAHPVPGNGTDKLPCPFAASGATMAAPAHSAAPTFTFLAQAEVAARYHAPADAPPLRHAAARGPPLTA